MKLEKFDYQIKNNKKNKTVIFLGISIMLIIAGFVVFRSFAAYEVTEPYNIIKGSVAEFSQVPLKISYNLVGEDGGIMSTNKMPSPKEYEFDATASNCKNGNTIDYDKDNNTITIGNNAEDIEDVCNIYFNFIPLSKQTLYALGLTMDDVKEGTPYKTGEQGESGYYAAPDNYGTSYYYYNDGSDSHPMIYIDDIMFLIIRINGNGTLRIVQDVMLSSAYNSLNNDNSYVGYMFGDIGSLDYFKTHSNKNASLLYSNHSFDVVRAELTGDAIFCNDRTLYKEEYGEIAEGDTKLGTAKNTTYYGPYYRLRNETPSLICERKEDSFTIEESEIGNGLLDYSAGTLSVDELFMTNASAIQDWWQTQFTTSSPAYFKDGVAYIYKYNLGYIPSDVSYSQNLVNYVTNLKHGLEYTGTGTWGDEYLIVE